MDRRQFLLHAGAIGAAASLGQLGSLTARAQTTGDYRALVCIFLAGGNDANNTLIPIDSTGYAGYSKVRGSLALAQSSLLPLAESSGSALYGLHPQLAALQSAWSAGQLAVVHNVGTLLQPMSKAEYLDVSVAKPYSLFSHIDQQHQWETVSSASEGVTGWGGRLTDQLATYNSAAQVPAMISTSGNNLFVTASASQALSIPVSGSFGLRGFSTSAADSARRTALQQLLQIDREGDLMTASQDVISNALQASTVLNPVLTATTGLSVTAFNGLTTGIAKQLLAVARIIEARASLGAGRQVFMVTLGGFDTHTNELATQNSLFGQLSPALAAFQSALTAMGAASSVTTFTLSDFSRTFKPNTGGGTDHAWGSTAFVMGGAVKGGHYGTAPTLELGSDDDEGSQGRWIPTTSVDQYAGALAGWMGASSTALASVLPNLSAFPAGALDFL